MRQIRLLEHIRNQSSGTGLNSETHHALIDSVRNHLQLLLNTKRGVVILAEDYGMPDFTNFLSGYPSTIPEMEKLIKQTIIKYEPRLSDPQVKFAFDKDSPLQLKFKIIATLYDKNKNAPITFESNVTPDGKVKLKQ